MKNITKYFLFLMVSLLVTACGIEYKIITTIFPDGSCERVMIAKIDSSEFNNKSYAELFFLPIDSSWTITTTTEHDTAEDKTFSIIKASKFFTNITELSDKLNSDTLLSEKPQVTINFTKQFRWFHTHYRFEETYRKKFPYDYYPITDYLTQEEIEVFLFEDPTADSIYYHGKDSLEQAVLEEVLDNKFQQFISDNVFEEFYQSLLDAKLLSEDSMLLNLKDPAVKAEMKKLLKTDFDWFESNSDDTEALQLLNKLDSHYKTNLFSGIFQTDSSSFKQYNKKLAIDFLTNYHYSYSHYINLPGSLVNTNSTDLEGITPVFHLSGLHYAFSDYPLWVESQKSNTWAYIITILVFLLAIAFTWGRRGRKR